MRPAIVPKEIRAEAAVEVPEGENQRVQVRELLDWRQLSPKREVRQAAIRIQRLISQQDGDRCVKPRYGYKWRYMNSDMYGVD